MLNARNADVGEPLATATELDPTGIVTRGCAYTLAKQGIIPSYLVGPQHTGVRFRRSKVLAALRRPVRTRCGKS